MPLSADNIIQQASGSFAGSGTVTLPTGTQAGSQIVLVAGLLGDGSAGINVPTPTGFLPWGVNSYGAQNNYGRAMLFVKASADAGETSWAVSSSSGTHTVLWVVLEMFNLDLDWPQRAYLPLSGSGSGVTTAVSSATVTSDSQSETYQGLSLACFMAVDTGGSTPVVSGHDNGFTEIASQSGSDGTRGAVLSVAAKQELVINTPQCAVSVSPTSYVGTALLVSTGLDSHHAPNITTMSGFEVGTATNLSVTGLGTATGTLAPFDAVVGTPAVVSTAARSGGWCLELSSSAATENVTWMTGGGKNLKGSVIETWSERLHVYFPTSLPSGDVELASVEAGSLANGVVIRYVSASQKIGVKVGTGSEQLSDAAVAANTWIGIDFLYDPRTTTHTCAWQVDYNAATSDATAPVAQSTASASGMSAAQCSTVRHGWTVAATATVRYDDIVGSRFRKTYPIGDMRVVPLGPDPAGTPTVSGSSANFRTFTNNGTLAAWTAAATWAALDDLPPTIGASADGLAQITNATTDYVQVPMATYACAANNMVPIAGRWYWAGWAASGNPATFKFVPNDGSGHPTWEGGFAYGETLDAGFDSTSLIWMGMIHNPVAALGTFYQLSQAKVDALAARFGFSEDTNPDAGVHCVLFELAVQPAVTVPMMAQEDGAFTVSARLDERSGAVVSLLATTPTGTRGATLTWTVGGSDGSQYVAPNSTHEQPLGGVDVSTVTRVGLSPDPGA